MEKHLERSIHLRVAESDKLRRQYPDKYPILIGKAPDCTLNDTNKFKFLVPGDLTIGQFVYVIRKHVKLTSEQSIFIMVNNVLPPTSSLISDIFAEHYSSDGFLYVIYTSENVFG